MLSPVDDTHATAPDRLYDLITIGEYFPYQFILFDRDKLGIVERTMGLAPIEGPVAFKTSESGFLTHDNFQR